MNDNFEIDICEHCGSEFQRGYWRHDVTLCASCLLLTQELTGTQGHGASDEFDGAHTVADDDWDYSEAVPVEDISLGTTLGHLY